MDLDDLSALRTPEGSALLAELRGLRPADELAALTRLRRA
ncbi:SAM-dependent methyltransferase, partial [Streptomyces sp. NEAU-H3]|nr:SAM-dependent methyltransferase [Streptomyces sp. NEAU-H3]